MRHAGTSRPHCASHSLLSTAPLSSRPPLTCTPFHRPRLSYTHTALVSAPPRQPSAPTLLDMFLRESAPTNGPRAPVLAMPQRLPAGWLSTT
mmetsp:Transcript_14952/g.38577  ORF Transcript_14952/g.38577 Transcript_14952/m.38577 type:complete len:92 (-) Transcript_14952:1472-1747(-)